MTRRKWSSEQKLQIVLEGLSGKLPLSQLCAHHRISQAQFYQWKDRLLKEVAFYCLASKACLIS
ncbi:MAG: transposase [Opitutales bacterium]|nr:transposase [Opitutales bacterium]